MRGLLAMLACLPAVAQAADLREGQRLAEQWCANCHRIAAAGPGPASDAVASFAAIAGRQGASLDAISAFLRTPHAGMPDHGLTLRQAQDLAAFVLEQRPR